jgi:chitosanase
MLTELQKKTAQAVVNIFETGKPHGDYSRVTLLKNDNGHLTYGRSQTTLNSGNLALLLHAYCDANGLLSDSLKPYLKTFDNKDLSLDNNEKVKSLLRQAGDDAVMQQVQDEFYDRVYWGPSIRSAEYIGVSKPLSITVVYDSWVHGSYHLIRDMTNQDYGEAKNIGEEEWLKAYVSVRRNWLANNSNELLHKTVYRMDSFRDLFENNKWELQLPLTVRNVVIIEELFNPDYALPAVLSAADADERVLFLKRPMMKGEDVKKLQRALGFSEREIDGVFGKDTDAAVREFQMNHGLKVDGKVGPATWADLGA